MCTMCEPTAPFKLTHSSSLDDYLSNNQVWSSNMQQTYPTLFTDYNSKGQDPHTLFIGCGDSRYNENCLGVLPGEVFTLKTVGNNINTGDLTTMSTLEFSVIYLKVNKIVIMGHTDCGAIKSCSDSNVYNSLSSNLHQYLKPINDLINEKRPDIAELDEHEQMKQFSIYNIKKQYKTLTEIPLIKEYLENEKLEIMTLLYNVDTGLIEPVVC
ncbi:hypothetical protein ACO0QE_001201 [Hanseniaspora vineae]